MSPSLPVKKSALTFHQIVSQLRETFRRFPDPRTGNNTQYSLEDAGLSAFSVFFMQCPSFLEYQRTMAQTQNRSNAQSLFGVHKIPCDNQIRKLLDSVPPESVFPMFWYLIEGLKVNRWLDKQRNLAGTLLIPIDGTEYFSSAKIYCERCSKRVHRNGEVTYSHQALTPVIIAQSQVLPLPPAFIEPQEGNNKQDCELNAAKRWLNQWGERLKALNVTILGDDLYSHQPYCQTVLNLGLHFLLVCKSDSHPTLYEWLDYLEKTDSIVTVIKRRWTGKHHETDTYHYVNQVPLRDGDDALRVNWCELTTSRDDGKILYHNTFVTSHKLNSFNVIAVVKAGRSRWQIENENNNTLKTHGYHFEHNFGHGQQYLASLLATLIILAFLFHTWLELMDQTFQILRHQLPSRRRLFNDLRALTTYFYFESWTTLLKFMILGIKSRYPPPT